MIKEFTIAGIKLNSYTALENLTRIGEKMDKHIFDGKQMMKTGVISNPDVKISITDLKPGMILSHDIYLINKSKTIKKS